MIETQKIDKNNEQDLNHVYSQHIACYKPAAFQALDEMKTRDTFDKGFKAMNKRKKDLEKKKMKKRHKNCKDKTKCDEGDNLKTMLIMMTKIGPKLKKTLVAFRARKEKERK